MELRKTPEEIQKTLDYYGVDLDDSGEPDEVPDYEGIVPPLNQDEVEQALKAWAEAVHAWRIERGEIQ